MHLDGFGSFYYPTSYCVDTSLQQQDMFMAINFGKSGFLCWIVDGAMNRRLFIGSLLMSTGLFIGVGGGEAMSPYTYL